MEKVIDNVILIFKHLHDKDIFENYYKNLLSKRLLSHKNISDENEKCVLKKLKAECGYQFTSKMEGMFTDITLSKGLAEEYHKHVLENGHSVDAEQEDVQNQNGNTLGRASNRSDLGAVSELDITVLTAGHWPVTSSAPSCVLPPPVATAVQSFVLFYLNKHNGRRINWLTHLGNADMKITFRKGATKEFSVSTYQMSILALFNEKDTVSLQEMRVRCNITDGNELKRHVLSLCTPKAKILNKSSKGKVSYTLYLMVVIVV